MKSILVFKIKQKHFCSLVKCSCVLDVIPNSLRMALMSLVLRFYWKMSLNELKFICRTMFSFSQLISSPPPTYHLLLFFWLLPQQAATWLRESLALARVHFKIPAPTLWVVGLWASLSTSRSVHFLPCKMELIISTPQCCKKQWHKRAICHVPVTYKWSIYYLLPQT